MRQVTVLLGRESHEDHVVGDTQRIVMLEGIKAVELGPRLFDKRMTY